MEQLSTWDYLIIAAYIAGVVVLGFYFSSRQKSLHEYFLASGDMPWWAVAISLHATLLSPVSFLGITGWIFFKDSRYFFGSAVFMMPVMFISALLWVPVWGRLRLFSIYEYLERRYHQAVRVFAAALFPISILFWVGNGLVAASKAFSAVSNVDVAVCLVAIVAIGTTYTVLGGARAVIWTDVVQAVVFLVAYVVSALLILDHFDWQPGQIYAIASSVTSETTGYPPTALVSVEFDLAIEATLWAIIFTRLTEIIGFGTNQTFVQRLLATGSRRNMIKAMLGKGGIDIFFFVLVIITGWGLVAFYHENQMAAIAIEHPDDVMAHFVVSEMPIVLRGVILAGLFAALMSTFDSALNSISSVTINDFYRRYIAPHGDERHHVAVSRIVCVGFALVLLLYALWQHRHSGATVMERLGKLNNLLIAPLICFFVLGILTRRANTMGVLIGGISGIVIAILFQGVPGWFDPPVTVEINWQWIGGLSTLASIGIGYTASFLFPRPLQEKTEGLTLWSAARAWSIGN